MVRNGGGQEQKLAYRPKSQFIAQDGPRKLTIRTAMNVESGDAEAHLNFKNLSAGKLLVVT